MAESEYSCVISNPPPSEPADPFTTELVALRLLSSNLETLFFSPSHADAYITLPKPHPPLPVHRCLLSARSSFFRDQFAGSSVHLQSAQLLPRFPVEPDALRFTLAYIYTGRVTHLPTGSCCCADDSCLHVACRPAISFMLQVLYSSSVFQIFELVSLFQRHLLCILDEVSEDDILMVLSVANLCGKSCEKLLADSMYLAVQLNHNHFSLEKSGLPEDLVEQIARSNGAGEWSMQTIRILRALDSHDLELLKLLLDEDTTTSLDDAHALHYAVANCETRVVAQLLELGLADVNLRDRRGYMALHVAAMRKEPMIIVLLLEKGASYWETTPDGRKAIQIARQVTQQGSVASNEKLCIEILKNADAPAGEDFVHIFFNAGSEKDFDARFEYMKLRVSLAKHFFEEEALIAIENAKVNGASAMKKLAIENLALLGLEQEDLEDISMILDDHQTWPNDSSNSDRLDAAKGAKLRMAIELAKTIETAKRFFPRCTTTIDQYMDRETVELSEFAGEEEKAQLKRRLHEVQQELEEMLFNGGSKEEDMKASSSSSSTSKLRRNGSTRPTAKSARRRNMARSS